MKILVISDSHGEDARIKALLAYYTGKVRAVIHLGDNDRDLLKYQDETELPLYTVAGNCDDTVFSPRERLLTFGKCKILLTHGNKHHLNSGFISLYNHARAQQASACLYGHTHIAAIFTEGDIFFMNPGSIAEPRDHMPPSYGLLTIDDATGEVSGEIIRL
ncbi:MAG: metallophosphoesterase [Defluviitaleaceae bacterium]|nr:metallophosphoesterase [Defluviitaleaceae bacterium]